MPASAMKAYFQIAECSFSSAKIRFSSERCKDFGEKCLRVREIKKVYPRLPDVLGKKDTPYYIIVLLFPFLSNR